MIREFKENETSYRYKVVHSEQYVTTIYFNPCITPLDETKFADICKDIFHGSGGRTLVATEMACYGIVRVLVNPTIESNSVIGIKEEEALKTLIDFISESTIC